MQIDIKRVAPNGRFILDFPSVDAAMAYATTTPAEQIISALSAEHDDYMYVTEEGTIEAIAKSDVESSPSDEAMTIGYVRIFV